MEQPATIEREKRGADSGAAHGSTIPETVILDMQSRAYARKDELVKLQEIAAQKQADYVKAKHDVEVAEMCLREIADFLQENNSGAVDEDTSWHAELGLSNSN